MKHMWLFSFGTVIPIIISHGVPSSTLHFLTPKFEKPGGSAGGPPGGAIA